MNSAYGAIGNKGFRFYNAYIAESITMLGQYALKTIENEIDEILTKKFKLDKKHPFLVYVDTDSISLHMAPVVEKYLKGKPTDVIVKTIEKMAVDIIQPEVNKLMDRICSQLNAFENRLSFKLEAVGDMALHVQKKKYVVRVHSSEGVTYAKPKYKVMGLDMVRSSTPAFIRDKLRGSLDLIFNTNEKEVQKYISGCRSEFNQLPPSQIAFPRSANNLSEYSDRSSIYRKGCPIQVRAALLYNHHVDRLGLEGKYPKIAEGSKIKFMYLKLPNKLRENIIAIPSDGELPIEFGVHSLIDYDEQFNKTLVSGLQNMLTAIGWNATEVSTLDDFFS